MSAAALVADYLMPELTVNGWPLHLSRAELDVLAGDHAAALRAVEQVEALGYDDEEMWLWLAEIGAAADLWSGRAQSARDRVDRVWARVRPVTDGRARRQVLALGAQAAADLADADPALDRARAGPAATAAGRRGGLLRSHPGRLLGAAYGTTFDAELARLRRNGEERSWRAAKDTWASHDVPHHAAYAGWRLAERLVATARRKDAQSELASAYAAAEHHVPLRREIEGLARRARLPLPTAQPARVSPAAAATPRRWRSLALRLASSKSSGCSDPAPRTPRSAAGCT